MKNSLEKVYNALAEQRDILKNEFSQLRYVKSLIGFIDDALDLLLMVGD